MAAMTVSKQLSTGAAIAAGFVLVVSACGTQAPTKLAAGS
ncbi:hypothetical protein LX88_003372 [Lentzea californiensis]|nr:hypothetical protein [Lentzea californiensis]